MVTFIQSERAPLLLIALSLLLAASQPATAQHSYSRGQNISPAFEGWEQNPDGSFNFLFGYMNRNWEEEIDVPVGPDNNIEPGGPDQGQPTHFLPRRNRFIFKVRVPKDFGDRELVWTLTTKGKTERAYATLRTDYLVDEVVQASETGALGAGSSSPEVRANKRPVVTIEGEKRITARVGEPVALVVLVTDDGVPKARGAGLAGSAVRNSRRTEGQQPANPALTPPRRNTVGKRVGLHQGWFVYRGSGKVTFDPPQVKAWEDTRAGANSPWAPLWSPPALPPDGRWISRATFSEPGTYILRARADDGALVADQELTVIVK
jgi:hypothetical protein